MYNFDKTSIPGAGTASQRESRTSFLLSFPVLTLNFTTLVLLINRSLIDC